ncbi:MAG TPA: MFS transporter, partial [Pseudomonas sp.]|nr:MFS transporter [Pseudomonas sp.]
ASIGPLLAGVAMKLFGSHMLYAFFSLCALILVWRIRPKAVTNLHQVDDAPLHHVAMPDSMSSSPLVACLDPRVDEAVVQEQMQATPVDPAPETDPAPVVDESVVEGPPPPLDPDDHPHDLSRARP